uniref:ShKT domain-containing protein n=1 Tax=Panagrolaimus sp. ES5 TaxID=591445 RepID=A0AC34FV74_9BILA
MFGKFIILSLAFFAGSLYAQTCLDSIGLAKQCPKTCKICAAVAGGNISTTTAAPESPNAQTCLDSIGLAKQCPKTCKICAAVAGGNISTTTAAPESPNAQTCLDIIGPCLSGKCFEGTSCINDVCCTVAPEQNCENVLDDSFCTMMADKCTDEYLKDVMSLDCPKTCQTCGYILTTTVAPESPDESCMDKVGESGTSDCPKNADLCNSSFYYELMTEQCPKTCGRC